MSNISDLCKHACMKLLRTTGFKLVGQLKFAIVLRGNTNVLTCAVNRAIQLLDMQKWVSACTGPFLFKLAEFKFVSLPYDIISCRSVMIIIVLTFSYVFSRFTNIHFLYLTSLIIFHHSRMLLVLILFFSR